MCCSCIRHVRNRCGEPLSQYISQFAIEIQQPPDICFKTSNLWGRERIQKQQDIFRLAHFVSKVAFWTNSALSENRNNTKSRTPTQVFSVIVFEAEICWSYAQVTKLHIKMYFIQRMYIHEGISCSTSADKTTLTADVSQALFVHPRTVLRRGLISRFKWKHLCVRTTSEHAPGALVAWEWHAKITFASHRAKKTIGVDYHAPCAWTETHFRVAF